MKVSKIWLQSSSNFKISIKYEFLLNFLRELLIKFENFSRIEIVFVGLELQKYNKF